MAEAEKRDWSGHYPLITFRIRRNFPRPERALVEKYKSFFVPDISDQVGRMYTMDATIRSLYTPAPKLCGPALTVKCPPGGQRGRQEGAPDGRTRRRGGD